MSTQQLEVEQEEPNVNTSFKVTVPKTLLDYGIGQAEFQRRAVEWLVLSLYTQEKISSGKAASLLGIRRVDFLDLLHRYGIAYIDLSPEELDAELETARAVGRAAAS